MYAAHFGFTDQPFSATPDPRFFYENCMYREAFATLLYGVRERKGFIVLTGEVGTGKTTLLRRLMDELTGTVRFVFFYNTTLTFSELVDVVCSELEIPVEGFPLVKKLRLLNEFLISEAARGGSVVLLLDEAQNLSPEVLENLRLISNLETSREKLLQIVLVGQPELHAKLDDPALRQVRQRIAMRFKLKPVPDEEIEAFIQHRLRVAGRSRKDLFTIDAIGRIAVYTNGIPRLVNIICDAALLLGYGSGARMVTGEMIDEVAGDLELKPRTEQPRATTGRADARLPIRPWMVGSGRRPGVAGVVAERSGIHQARDGLR